MNPPEFQAPEPYYEELDVPCPLCGATGPCAFDNENRPLIHMLEDEIEWELADD